MSLLALVEEISREHIADISANTVLQHTFWNENFPAAFKEKANFSILLTVQFYNMLVVVKERHINDNPILPKTHK